MTAPIELLDHAPGLADPICPAGCDHLDKYIGSPLCTLHEVKLRRASDGQALRCLDCMLGGGGKLSDKEKITSRQRMILAELRVSKKHLSPRMFEASRSPDYVRRSLCLLKEYGLVRIGSWAGSNCTALWVAGGGDDAPHPDERKQAMRAAAMKLARSRRHMRDEEIASAGMMDMPPTLPTHTPTYGMWGI